MFFYALIGLVLFTNMPVLNCQVWSKFPDGPDSAVQVEAFDVSGLKGGYSLLMVSNKGQLYGFNITNLAWVKLLDNVKNVGAGFDRSIWVVLTDGSVMRALFSKFGTPSFSSPDLGVGKLVEVSPLNFDQAIGISPTNEIFTLDTTLPTPPTWVKMDGLATWVTMDGDGVAWDLSLNDELNINRRENGKWVNKPGVGATISAVRSDDFNPLVVLTSKIQEIFIYSGNIYQPRDQGRPWTQLMGLLALQCSIGPLDLYCVAQNGTIFQAPVTSFAKPAKLRTVVAPVRVVPAASAVPLTFRQVAF